MSSWLCVTVKCIRLLNALLGSEDGAAAVANTNIMSLLLEQLKMKEEDDEIVLQV